MLVFFTSFVPRFFEHRFCIVLGSIFNEFLDRQFGDNLMFAGNALQKHGFAGSEIASTFSTNSKSIVPSILYHFGIILLYFFDIDFGIDFNRFGRQNDS